MLEFEPGLNAPALTALSLSYSVPIYHKMFSSCQLIFSINCKSTKCYVNCNSISFNRESSFLPLKTLTTLFPDQTS